MWEWEYELESGYNRQNKLWFDNIFKRVEQKYSSKNMCKSKEIVEFANKETARLEKELNIYKPDYNTIYQIIREKFKLKYDASLPETISSDWLAVL